MKKKKDRLTTNQTILVAVILVAVFFVLTETNPSNNNQPNITSFEECVNAGNPVMESYPRQCRANGQTFAEFITEKNCMVDSDCTLINEKLEYSCCYAGSCEIIDYSQKKWVSVNKEWFEDKQNRFCPPIENCGPAPGCATQKINDRFEATCVQNKCQKTYKID
jgi:hypothetical protein